MDGNLLIRSLQEGKNRGLESLYGSYRNDFISWASKKFRGIDRNDFIEAWQEAVIAFYDQVISKKLMHLDCDIKTYLFVLANRYLIKHIQKSQKTESLDAFDKFFDNHSYTIAFEWDAPWHDRKLQLSGAMHHLNNQCQELLLLKFGDGLSIESIMTKKGFSNLNSVSASLSRCLRKLKEIIQEQIHNKS